MVEYFIQDLLATGVPVVVRFTLRGRFLDFAGAALGMTI